VAYHKPIGPAPQIRAKVAFPVDLGFGTVGLRATKLAEVAVGTHRLIASFVSFFAPGSPFDAPPPSLIDRGRGNPN
jgi:hypothetical protein